MNLPDTEPLQLVSVVKTYFTGREETFFLMPLMAVQELLSPENGVTVKSLRIAWGNISSRTMDTSGSAFCAEWSVVKSYEEPDSAGEINWKID